MINETELVNNNLKIKRKDMLVLLQMISTMGEASLLHNNMYMKENLKMDFSMEMEELNIIMDRYFKGLLQKDKNIWAVIHIQMVVIMMVCSNKIYQMELVNFIGLMV
jgi:hypothetical protein